MEREEKDIRSIPLIDPTENVLKHVEGAVRRLDDLRIAEDNRIKEVQDLHVKRIDDLLLAEARRINEEADMRADFAEKLREAEAKRIDAIRAVDVNAVAVASDRANSQAAILANQVNQSAETLRNLVTTTAATMAKQQEQSSQQFSERLSQVERVQYESKGKSGVADPILEKLILKIEGLIESRSLNAGEIKGRSDIVGWIIGGVMFIVSVLTLLLKFVK